MSVGPGREMIGGEDDGLASKNFPVPARRIGGLIFFARHVEEETEALYGQNPNAIPWKRRSGGWAREKGSRRCCGESQSAARSSARTSGVETRKARRRPGWAGPAVVQGAE